MPVSDQTILSQNKQSYHVKITAETDLQVPYFALVKYDKIEKKTICNSFADNILSKDLIGQLPIVVLSPDLKNITSGPPQERRSLLDKILSQSFKSYLTNWINLKKILKCRSNILAENLVCGNLNKDLLDTWTAYLIDVSTEIVFRRAEFTREFAKSFLSLYRELSDSKESVSIKYTPFRITETADKDEIKQQITSLSDELIDSEIKRGKNLFGPQRDDLIFTINGGNAKDFASQGQHKTLLIAIKFAEFCYLQETLHETPIILLDDIFSELDSERIAKVIDLVTRYNAQTFITVNYTDFLSKINVKDGYRIIPIVDGKVAL